MAIIRWDPFRELREISKILDESFPLTSTATGGYLWSPSVDLIETADEFIVKTEVPGVLQEDIQITLENDILLIQGEKKAEAKYENETYHRIERSYGAFQRMVTIPQAVKAEEIKATLKDGVLEIHLPKVEETKPKQIKVEIEK